jgi:hypothetical protein
MNLSVAERLILLQALPEEGDLTTIRIVSKLRGDLSFNEDEHAVLAFEATDVGVKWNSDADPQREYDFGAKARDTIVKALTKLDKDGKLRAEHLTVCDKFGLGADD